MNIRLKQPHITAEWDSLLTNKSSGFDTLNILYSELEKTKKEVSEKLQKTIEELESDFPAIDFNDVIIPYTRMARNTDYEVPRAGYAITSVYNSGGGWGKIYLNGIAITIMGPGAGDQTNTTPVKAGDILRFEGKDGGEMYIFGIKYVKS